MSAPTGIVRRPTSVTQRALETKVLGLFSAFLLLLMILPILMVIIISFTSANTLAFPPPGWSLQWYRSAFRLMLQEDPTQHTGRFLESLLTSIAIAASVTVMTVLVAVPAAYSLHRYRFSGKLLVEQLINLPLVFPVVVLAIALLVMASQIRADIGFLQIVIGHSIITLPFVIRNCAAGLKAISVNLEEAARTLGANAMRGFFEIVLPLMRSGILAGALMAFIISFNEFTISYFLYTVDVQPFSIWLFTRSNTSLDPTIFAVSSLIILFDAVMILLLDRIIGRDGLSL